jgi:hypothetical protein
MGKRSNFLVIIRPEWTQIPIQIQNHGQYEPTCSEPLQVSITSTVEGSEANTRHHRAAYTSPEVKEAFTGCSRTSSHTLCREAQNWIQWVEADLSVRLSHCKKKREAWSTNCIIDPTITKCIFALKRMELAWQPAQTDIAITAYQPDGNAICFVRRHVFWLCFLWYCDFISLIFMQIIFLTKLKDYYTYDFMSRSLTTGLKYRMKFDLLCYAMVSFGQWL